MEPMILSHAELDDLAGHFRSITNRIPLGRIRTDDDYDVAVSAMNGLVDAGAGDEGHALAVILDLLGEVIADDDEARHALPDAPPAEVLKLLMDQHGLRQGDLPEIGSQGVVSEILSGKRDLNVSQIKRLAERFHVGPATFL